ncbi:MAG: spermidine synthase [Bacteroidales bacterium]|nr:spermidine synthase [Bacteroidales bacterium]
MTQQNNIIVENKEVQAVVYNFQQWITITDPKDLKNEFTELLSSSGYHVLNFIEHFFPNGGYTCLWLLAESHLAIHTFVKDNKTYIELTGCNKMMNEKFRKSFEEKFAKNLID